MASVRRCAGCTFRCGVGARDEIFFVLSLRLLGLFLVLKSALLWQACACARGAPSGVEWGRVMKIFCCKFALAGSFFRSKFGFVGARLRGVGARDENFSVVSLRLLGLFSF